MLLILFFITLQETNLTKEGTLSKKGTKRAVINAPSAERLHTRNYISVQHLNALPLLQFINEYRQEKSPISVVRVGRPLVKWVISRDTRASILWKSRTSVLSAGRPLVEMIISRHTRGSILGKSRISVLGVKRPFAK